MENETGRDAQIVLRLPIRGGFREARQEIFSLSRSERQTMESFTSTPTAKETERNTTGNYQATDWSR